MMGAKEGAVSEINPKTDLKLARGMVVAQILSARTLEGCERAAALIEEWAKVFPNDHEILSYGGFVNRMASAIRYSEEKEAR